MKKKLSLLLVLSLILSMIPMNAFGAAPPPTILGSTNTVGGRVTSPLQLTDGQAIVTANIDVRHFVGMDLTLDADSGRYGVPLVATINNDNKFKVKGTENNDLESINPDPIAVYDFLGNEYTTAGAFSITPGIVYGDKNYDSSASTAVADKAALDKECDDIYFMLSHANGVITPAGISYEQYSLPINFNVKLKNTGDIVIKFVNSGKPIFSAEVASLGGGSLEILAGAPADISTAGLLNTITFKEGKFGDLGEGPGVFLTIVLEAPRYYTWHVGAVVGQNATNFTTKRGTFTPPGSNTDTAYNVGSANAPWLTFTAPWNKNLAQVLVIQLDATRAAGSGILSTLADELRLNNLWLIPEERAPMSGDVDVWVGIGSGVSTSIATMKTYTDSNIYGTRETQIANEIFTADWSQVKGKLTDGKMLTVGKRTTSTLTFGTLDQPLEVRTGSLGYMDFPDIDTMKGGGDKFENDVKTYTPNGSDGIIYAGVQTQTVVLTETAPGAWGSTFGTPTVFSFDDDGVSILGARVWITERGQGDTGFNNTADKGGYQYRFQGWINTNTGLYPTSPYVKVAQHSVTVTYPTQNASDANKARSLYVEFFLSVEAGYEHKYDSNEITVKASGAGVAKADGDKEVAVALAIDPITVDAKEIRVPTGTTYFANTTEISDITITETEGHLFDVDDVIWVYVIGANRRTEVSFTANPNVTIESGQIRLERGKRLYHNISNIWLDGMAYTVERNSLKNEPSTFTITDCAISGQIYPGVDYKVIVSGQAVAENDQTVWSTRGLGTAGSFNVLKDYIYTTDPYAKSVITFDQIVSDDAPGDGTPGGSSNAYVGSATLPTLFTNMPTNRGTQNPFIYRPNTTGTTNVGYVSVAAFLDILRDMYGESAVVTNADAWDSATSTATIWAPNKSGTVTTVKLTVLGSKITINGEEQDIAEAVGGSSGPTGTVVAIYENNQNYLPVRALAAAFGWAVEAQGNALLFK